jgi:ferrous iron transport protein A
MFSNDSYYGVGEVIPLTQAPAGIRVRLVSIAGGRQLARRLLALGLSVGSELEVLHHRGHGVVVARDGNRVALGGGVAEHLLAEILT